MYPRRRCHPLGNRTNVFSVPRDSVERACRPLQVSHHRTWSSIDALLATVCRAVSEHGERAIAARGAAVPRGTADTPKKALPKQHQGTPRGVPPQSPPRRLTELFSPISKGAQIADPDAAHLARFGQLCPTRLERRAIAQKFHLKEQGPPGRIKSLQEGLDRSWDAHAIGQAFAVLCFAPNMQR